MGRGFLGKRKRLCYGGPRKTETEKIYEGKSGDLDFLGKKSKLEWGANEQKNKRGGKRLSFLVEVTSLKGELNAPPVPGVTFGVERGSCTGKEGSWGSSYSWRGGALTKSTGPNQGGYQGTSRGERVLGGARRGCRKMNPIGGRLMGGRPPRKIAEDELFWKREERPGGFSWRKKKGGITENSGTAQPQITRGEILREEGKKRKRL